MVDRYLALLARPVNAHETNRSVNQRTVCAGTSSAGRFPIE